MIEKADRANLLHSVMLRVKYSGNFVIRAKYYYINTKADAHLNYLRKNNLEQSELSFIEIEISLI